MLSCEVEGLMGPSPVSLDPAGGLRPKNAAILCLSFPLAMVRSLTAALLCYVVPDCMLWLVNTGCRPHLCVASVELLVLSLAVLQSK